MRAVVTVIGNDKVGIIAAVTAFLAQHKINVLDISQTILQDIFTMIMVTDISAIEVSFADIVVEADKFGCDLGVKIQMQHEDIFNSMHRI